MKHQLKFLWSIAIIGSLSTGCQKENMKPVSQPNQSNPTSSGREIGTLGPKKGNGKVNGSGKISKEKRVQYVKDPQLLRKEIGAIKWKIGSANPRDIALSSQAIDWGMKEIARQIALYKELNQSASSAIHNKKNDLVAYLFKKVSELGETIESNQRKMGIVMDGLEILKELHESPELLELAKVDLQEHERLLNEIEGN